MSSLRIGPVTDDATLEDWRLVHNAVVPDAAMSTDEARERVGRYLLEVAYDGDVLVGCTTVRPPEAGGGASTVIVRVLPQWRGRGLGSALYERAMRQAAEQAPDQATPAVETVVWAANTAGVRFAEARGFAEVDRYEPEPGAVPYLTLRRPSA
ncbi:N-acetyltransferase family protein [Dactylosporangium sp. CA-152071]|uniref:GNAT family N-acetyltransferase n=1 Tax=Dactylosporangium sp. CA-152071 TaxID=3239933 RepID=UPI003D8B168E